MEEHRPKSTDVPHPGLVLTMVAASTAWVIVVIGFGDFAANGRGMPNGTWWVLWLLIAVVAIPVFSTIRSLFKKTEGKRAGLLALVVLMLPPTLAIGLLLLAGRCANMAALTGRSGGGSCPSHPVVIGWVWMWFGLAALWAVVAYILITDVPEQRDHLPTP